MPLLLLTTCLPALCTSCLDENGVGMPSLVDTSAHINYTKTSTARYGPALEGQLLVGGFTSENRAIAIVVPDASSFDGEWQFVHVDFQGDGIPDAHQQAASIYIQILVTGVPIGTPITFTALKMSAEHVACKTHGDVPLFQPVETRTCLMSGESAELTWGACRRTSQ
ncbi:MAG: hypothetical protein AAB337_03805 [Patescibacteria group bacterium]